MTDIIRSAITVVQMPGMTERQAARALVDSLNDDLGAAYSTNNLGKWRRAERSIPQPVQDWMLRVSIAWAVRQVGGSLPFDDERLDTLASMLCPPARK